MDKSLSPYPTEVRRQIVELVRAGRAPEELADEYALSEQTIHNWVRGAASEGEGSESNKGSAITKMIALVRAENASAKPVVEPETPSESTESTETPQPSAASETDSTHAAPTSDGNGAAKQEVAPVASADEPQQPAPAAAPVAETPAAPEQGTAAAREAHYAPAVIQNRSTVAPYAPQSVIYATEDSVLARSAQDNRRLFNESVPADRGDEINVAQQLRILWERKWIIFATVFLIVSLAYLYARDIVPQYTAVTLIMIESELPEIVEVDAVKGALSIDELTIQSEVSVLQSRMLAEKVVDHLNLVDNPEFNPALREPPTGLKVEIDKAVEWVKQQVGLAKPPGAPVVLTEEEKQARTRLNAVDAYLGRVKVDSKSRSRVISIEFNSSDPETAATVANAVADVYLLQQRENKLEAARHATEWLNDRSASLREKVAASERAIGRFKEENQLLEGTTGALVAEQITSVNAELARTGAERAQLEARLARVRSLAGDPAGIDSASEVLESQVIRGLRDAYVQLERQKTELSARFNPSHSRIVSIEAEQAYLQQQINSEIDKIIKGLGNRVAVAQAHEASLEKSLNELKTQAAEASTAALALRGLEREAEADRALLTTFLARAKETSAQDIEFHQADARILSRATVPDSPKPIKKLIMAAALAASLLLGVLLAAVLERARTGDVFLSGEQIERIVRVPYLALVPLAKAPRGKLKSPAANIMQRPRSAFTESIRGLWASIMLSNVHAVPKTIMFSSSQPNEGKTTIAASVAKHQANAGKRVVLVDTDIRRPGAFEAFNVANEPGLCEFLRGTARLEEVIKTDEETGAHVIPAGTGSMDAFDTLCAAPMEQLLKDLSQSYDIVILDTPPLLAVPDARILSGKVDATVFVVRWAETKRDMAVLAMRQLIESNGRLTGVVLSMVDSKKNAKYGFGDSGLYSGAAAGYYTSASQT